MPGPTEAANSKSERIGRDAVAVAALTRKSGAIFRQKCRTENLAAVSLGVGGEWAGGWVGGAPGMVVLVMIPGREGE